MGGRLIVPDVHPVAADRYLARRSSNARLAESEPLLNAFNNDGLSGADSTECTERTDERTEWTERTGHADGSNTLPR
jgi:hypothetical protein